jgi:hypothetical protein
MTQASAEGLQFRVTALACALMLAAAPIDWPYGYYQFMRLAVTGMSVWIVVTANRNKQGNWSVLGTALALLFNPLIPIHLDRSTWVPIDWIAATLLSFSAFKLSSHPTT